MTLHESKQGLKSQLTDQFDAIELNSLLSMLFEHVTGHNQLQQVINKNEELSETQLIALKKYADALANGKPIQYILGKAWFMGKEYVVNDQVLIPRPETEELVEWVIEYAEIINKPLHIIDIGTGSGCIPIAIKTALPDCSLSGLDISEGALAVAKLNAEKLNAQIEWIQQDILMSASMPGNYDIIVSNPPYIPFNEKVNMQVQVKNYEPAIALFVTNEDPLIFYRIIARLAKQCLNPNGQLFFEMHYDQGKAIQSLFEEMGYHAELRKDMFGKDRMIRASLKPKKAL
jgi:release factor glutamine methyltransferase